MLCEMCLWLFLGRLSNLQRFYSISLEVYAIDFSPKLAISLIVLYHISIACAKVGNEGMDNVVCIIIHQFVANIGRTQAPPRSQA